MKKILPILFFIALPLFNSCQPAAAQEQLTQVEKLSTTAKIWGFLKYYHPQVAKGKFNWDEQLFTVLEKVEKSKTREELAAVYTTWIDSLGEVKKCNSCLKVSTDEMFYKNFDLSWLESASFSKELVEKLKFIEKNRVQEKQYYISPNEGVGNITVQNEPAYEDFSWENKNLRLLALFRYWNQVEYFFPYKYQMEKNWDDVLEEILPKFMEPATEQEYHLAMLELTASLNDSHAWFITQPTNQYYGYYWAPVEIDIIDKKAVVADFFNDSLAKKDDWQLGDVLTAVDGVPVNEILEKRNKYLTGSNDPAKYRDVHIALLNGSNSSVEIEFLRDNNSFKRKVSRYYRKEFGFDNAQGSKWEILESNIGYVNMGRLEPNDVKEMMHELKATKAIIFDIRNYPKGTLYAIAKELNKESIPFVKFTVPNLQYPGKYKWTKPLAAGTKNPDFYKGKVILLVNEETQSHAEFTAMALQTAPDVVTIGSQTSGADGNVSDLSFVGGFQTYISGIGVFYPDGRETQRIGIVPDMEVKRTIAGIKEGRDEVMEKALEVANK